MCLICVDIQKETLTTTEAWRNLQEMKESMTDEHYDDVVALLIDRLYAEQHGPEFTDLIDTIDEEKLFSFLDEKELELNFDEEPTVWASDFDGYFVNENED